MLNEQDAMDQHFRLIALELLMIDLLESRYLASPDPVATAHAHREHMRNVLSEVALPGLGSASASELAVGGVGDAIDRLLENAGQTAARRADELRRS